MSLAALDDAGHVGLVEGPGRKPGPLRRLRRAGPLHVALIGEQPPQGGRAPHLVVEPVQGLGENLFHGWTRARQGGAGAFVDTQKL